MIAAFREVALPTAAATCLAKVRKRSAWRWRILRNEQTTANL
jgi:hypothetical protein